MKAKLSFLFAATDGKVDFAVSFDKTQTLSLSRCARKH